LRKTPAVADPTSQLLLARLIADDSAAATAIFDRYVERLLKLAKSHMSAKLKRRIDPEDVVQSAYRSFFVHARNEEFQLERAGDLWRLLADITLKKLYRQVEKQTAAKRSLNREEYLETLESYDSITPSVAEAVGLAEVMGLAVARLSDEERCVLIARLQGDDWEDIAESVGKSPRTVRRLLEQIENKIKRGLIDNTAQSPNNVPQQPQRPLSLEYSNYVLEKLIGAGGMGKVYRATEKSTGKHVALKSLHKLWNLEPMAIGRFLQEAEVLLQLDHPNIVKVRGMGRYPSGSLFMVMDFVYGTNLESRLHKNSLQANEVLSILSMIVSAVAYAHEQGVIHCDLKPANILLNHRCEAIVTDFGFANVMKSGRKEIAPIGGTPGYIAPEVLAGNPPSPRSDVFSLGSILDRIISRTKLPDDLRSGLSEVRDRCMQSDPRSRYYHAGELLTHIEMLTCE
jgi:RNA polymerase sigma factor (sigma-70 family)